MWYHSANSDNIKPQTVEKTNEVVFMRKNFVLIPADEDAEVIEHWEYDEMKVPASLYPYLEEIEAKADYAIMIAQ